MANRITQTSEQALVAPDPKLRVTTAAEQVLVEPEAQVLATQSAMSMLTDASPEALVTQASEQLLTQPSPNLVATQAAHQLLVKPTPRLRTTMSGLQLLARQSPRSLISQAAASFLIPNIPFASISVNTPSIVFGQSATVTWTTSEADTAVAGGDWSGPLALSGSEVVTPPSSGTYVYQITVSQLGVSRTYQTSLVVTGVARPTGTFSASAPTVNLGDSVTLTWATADATVVTASGDWSGSLATSGSETITPVSSGSYSYTLTADGPGGELVLSVGVNVVIPTGSGDVTSYLNLVTKQHRNRPRFIGLLSTVLQPVVDSMVVLESMPQKYDLDTATGAQLDAVGLWVGAPRTIRLDIGSGSFSFDIGGLGYDEGDWYVTGTSDSASATLTDAQYRAFIKARIVNNTWDGSVEQAYRIWDTLFLGSGLQLEIIDHGDNTMELGISGGTPDPVFIQLLEGGYLDVRPSGIQIINYNVS